MLTTGELAPTDSEGLLIPDPVPDSLPPGLRTVACAVAIGARIGPRKVPAHLGAVFVDRAVAFFQVHAGKELLAAHHS